MRTKRDATRTNAVSTPAHTIDSRESRTTRQSRASIVRNMYDDVRDTVEDRASVARIDDARRG
jgi:hypothetical protein